MKGGKENKSKNLSGLFFLFILLAGLAVAVYWPVLNNTLISDDHFYYYELRSLPVSELGSLFTLQSNFSVRPFTWLTYWIQFRLFDFNPWPAHLINVFLHAGVASLMFWLLRMLGARGLTATAAAVLFLVTPVAPEAATWLSGRHDLMALFFTLLTVGLYFFALKKKSWGYFGTAMAAAMAALLSKEQAYMLVLMLPAMELLYADRSSYAIDSRKANIAKMLINNSRAQFSDWKFLTRMFVFSVIVFASVVLHYAILGRMGGYGDLPLLALPGANALSTLKTTLSPLNSAEVSWGLIRYLGFYSATLFLIGGSLVILRWRRAAADSKKMLVFMIIFLIGSLLPGYAVLSQTGVSNNLRESRLLYSPTLAVLALLAISMLEFGWHKRSWRIFAILALSVLLPVYIAGLHANNRPWQRAAAMNYSIPKQTVELIPDPPQNARMTFIHVPAWKDSYVFVIGFRQALYSAYGRDDIIVTRVRRLASGDYFDEPLPESDTDGYLIDYDQEQGLLRLVKDN
ncbi:MAG: glycosyltransferase family 39 protein [Thermoleophilia bacterium]|nr:glycosyltransferase family 39 protein [Thermoleophilia bacterium]